MMYLHVQLSAQTSRGIERGATYSVFRKLSRSVNMPPSQNCEVSMLRKSLAL
jgi:hypothetical protein